jgi:hypothetical protein
LPAPQLPPREGWRGKGKAFVAKSVGPREEGHSWTFGYSDSRNKFWLGCPRALAGVLLNSMVHKNCGESIAFQERLFLRQIKETINITRFGSWTSRATNEQEPLLSQHYFNAKARVFESKFPLRPSIFKIHKQKYQTCVLKPSPLTRNVVAPPITYLIARAS